MTTKQTPQDVPQGDKLAYIAEQLEQIKHEMCELAGRFSATAHALDVAAHRAGLDATIEPDAGRRASMRYELKLQAAIWRRAADDLRATGRRALSGDALPMTTSTTQDGEQ